MGKTSRVDGTQKELSAARRPRDAQGNSGANPDVTKTQERVVAPTSSHGDAARPSPEIPNATRSPDGAEASLLAFLRGETSPATTAARFNLDQVQLDARWTAPQPASRCQLLAVAQILSAFPKARVFIGHAGGGHRAASPRIVKARLLSVWRELTQMGVDPAPLSSRGHVECQRPPSTTPKTRRHELLRSSSKLPANNFRVAAFFATAGVAALQFPCSITATTA